ncbi:hypothetical protein F4604DRAFT_1923200 [Suillus subluteus]|nr:hypothetical protein F4604DRAFT_1923200 [Suillus subluteus]
MSTTGPIYIYVQTIDQVLRLLPVNNEEPFHGLSGQFLFMGYIGHAHQLSPIYWPEEYSALVRPPILCHVRFLLDTRFSIYEIESGGSAFLNNCKTNVCTPNSHGGISPIWLLDQLVSVQFTPATYPHRFPPPATPIPANVPAWQTSFPQTHHGGAGYQLAEQLSSSQAAFSEAMLFQSLDFKYEPTILELTSIFNILPTPTLLDDDSSISNIMTLINPQSLSEVVPPHPDLHWRRTARGNPLAKGQKLLLKGLLAASPWGCSIKLAKYLFIRHFLVGTPLNPFFVPEAVSRQLITTSFLRALRFNEKTYNELSSKLLTIINDDGSETIVGWPYLRNQFLDFYIDVTSELRKITQGSTSPLAGFALNEDKKMQRILNLIVLLNLDTNNWYKKLSATLLEHKPSRRSSGLHYYDLSPTFIQFILIPMTKIVPLCQMYQAFTLQIPSDSTNLKAPELHPRIMAALDEMYMHPDHFGPFFQVARELPSLQETNVLVMDPKHKVPKHTMDVMGVRRMKTLKDLEPIDVASTSDFEVLNIHIMSHVIYGPQIGNGRTQLEMLAANVDSSPSSFKRAPAYARTLRISRSRAHLARLRIAYARLRAHYFPASTSARLVDIVSLHLIREELLSVAVLWVELYSRIQVLL